MQEDIESLPVVTLVGPQVTWVAPDTDLVDVASALTIESIGAVVVGAHGGLRGILSERDVVHAVAAGRDLKATRAIDIASTELVWCDANAPIADVATEMMERYVRHVLVEDAGTLVGIVSARDLLGVYATSPVEVE